MRILMIGQAPNQHGDPLKPCTGRFMDFLCGVAGISRTRYLRAFERMNLLPAWPGKSGKGDAFPIEEARQKAAEIDMTGRVVVVCGQRAATAFGIKAAFLERVEQQGAVFYILPHPSGLNRWWNDLENRRRAGRLVRILVALPNRPTPARRAALTRLG